MSTIREDLPDYGATMFGTDEDRARLVQRRGDFAESTPWKIDGVEITSEASLLGALMTRSARDLAWTRDCIEDGLRRDATALAEWHRYVVEHITELCHRPYAPNPILIMEIISAGMELDAIAERYLSDTTKEGGYVGT